jgi:Icc protein
MKILHISDLHYETGKEFFPGVRENLVQVREQLQRLKADFMIVTGDLTTRGCIRKSDLQESKDWLDNLGIPYIAIPGNHDTGANEKRSKEFPDLEYYESVPFEQTNFGILFRGQSPVIMRDLGSVVIIALVLRENDPDNALALLQQMLKNITKPIILCGHYPLVKTREEGSLATFDVDYIPATAKQLQAIVEEHRNIKLYACGHIHVNSVQRIGDACLQMSAGAIGPGPSTFRLYSITDEELIYETLLGAGPLDFWHLFDQTYHYTADYHIGTQVERFGHIQLT